MKEYVLAMQFSIRQDIVPLLSKQDILALSTVSQSFHSVVYPYIVNNYWYVFAALSTSPAKKCIVQYNALNGTHHDTYQQYAAILRVCNNALLD